ncbi:MAG: flagellar biosynthetic protein FliO [Burkholderiales bacterium]
MTEGVSTLGAALQALVGLGIVVGLIVVTAYVLKRLQPGRFTASNLLRPVASLSLGARERVVVVEMGEQWLVLGVTAQNITTLHTAPKAELQSGHPVTPGNAAKAERPSFSDWLARARQPGTPTRNG